MNEFEILCEKIVMDEYRNNTLEILNIEANNEKEALDIVAKDIVTRYKCELLEFCHLNDGVLLLKSHKKTLPIITFKLKIVA